MPIKNTIIYKTLIILTLVITLFSAITLFYMYRNNIQISQTLINNQKRYVEQHLKKEQKRLIDRELEYIKEHALYIVDVVKQALLYNLDKEIIQESVKIFMKQKSVRSIYIHDGITDESYLSLLKNVDKSIVNISQGITDISDLKILKYPLQIDGNDFGYVKIYYDVIPFFEKIKNKISKGKREDYILILKQSKILEEDIYKFLMRNIIVLLLFIFTIFLVIFLLFRRYIHKPLRTVQNNLHKFFDFFKEAKSNLILTDINSNDEFGDMSKEINANIQTVLEIHNEIEETQKEILVTIGSIAEVHSEETSNHIKRVAKYSALLGKYYGLSENKIKIFKDASTMHDIGKIAIPYYILNKPGKLDSNEFEIMKSHALHGYNMLKHSNKPLFKAAATIAYEHHEKYNGTGYPNQIKGENIHIYGRITALADVFDALGSDRCYKKAWSDDKIFKLFEEERAKQFDPKLVDLFLEHKDKFIKIRDQYQD